jgi:hypothetical protein
MTNCTENRFHRHVLYVLGVRRIPKKVVAKGTPGTRRTTTSTKGAISKMRFVIHPSVEVSI